jgi:hypothetical protein
MNDPFTVACGALKKAASVRLDGKFMAGQTSARRSIGLFLNESESLRESLPVDQMG